jgi:hypothetical protein
LIKRYDRYALLRGKRGINDKGNQQNTINNQFIPLSEAISNPDSKPLLASVNPRELLKAYEDPKKRLVEFLPPARMMNIEELRNRYLGDKNALVSA